MTHFDYICIGGGSGGIASANRAAKLKKIAKLNPAFVFTTSFVSKSRIPVTPRQSIIFDIVVRQPEPHASQLSKGPQHCRVDPDSHGTMLAWHLPTQQQSSAPSV